MTYIFIFFGALLGLALTVAVKCGRIHASANYSMDWKQTLQYYTKRNPFAIVVGFLVIFIFMFLFPMFSAMYNNIDPDNPTKYSQYIKSVVEQINAWSIGLGVISQAAGFFVSDFGNSKIKEYDKKINNIKEE